MPYNYRKCQILKHCLKTLGLAFYLQVWPLAHRIWCYRQKQVHNMVG